MIAVKNKEKGSKLSQNDKTPDLSVKISLSQVQRDGLFQIDFNQELIIPDFSKSSDKKRYLQKGIIPSRINVARDIADITIKINSEEQLVDLTYYVTIIRWTKKNLQMRINFTNPLAISKGKKKD